MVSIKNFIESIRFFSFLNGVEVVNIYYRVKTKKLVHDYLGIRLILRTSKDCLRLGELISDNYQVLTERYRDYITNPWALGYRSIHIDILFEGRVFELQIRTEEMEKNLLN
ncbi:MAG: hypothetical protein WC928_03630 [Patescibacteria group bacterium]|jgi:(p)ppGpp synthase/HD superfamily hydrolase